MRYFTDDLNENILTSIKQSLTVMHDHFDSITLFHINWAFKIFYDDYNIDFDKEKTPITNESIWRTYKIDGVPIKIMKSYIAMAVSESCGINFDRVKFTKEDHMLCTSRWLTALYDAYSLDGANVSWLNEKINPCGDCPLRTIKCGLIQNPKMSFYAVLGPYLQLGLNSRKGCWKK